MKNEISKTLILSMRTKRQSAGYTQETLSHLLQIQRATYSNYENGLRTPPLEILVALAELYHVSTDYLIRGLDTYVCSNLTVEKIARIADSMPHDSQKDVLGYAYYRSHFPFAGKNASDCTTDIPR